jgi:nicotinamide mononucleotide adenylyltransferase
MSDDKCYLFIGRYQPLTQENIAIMQSYLDAGKKICVAICNTPLNDENPHTMGERILMFEKHLPAVEVISIPEIAEIHFEK